MKKAIPANKRTHRDIYWIHKMLLIRSHLRCKPIFEMPTSARSENSANIWMCVHKNKNSVYIFCTLFSAGSVIVRHSEWASECVESECVAGARTCGRFWVRRDRQNEMEKREHLIDTLTLQYTRFRLNVQSEFSETEKKNKRMCTQHILPQHYSFCFIYIC